MKTIGRFLKRVWKDLIDGYAPTSAYVFITAPIFLAFATAIGKLMMWLSITGTPSTENSFVIFLFAMITGIAIILACLILWFFLYESLRDIFNWLVVTYKREKDR